MTALDLYARALREPGPPLLVRSADGGSRSAALGRWLGPVSAVDWRLLERARGPVLDVGCGPGRHVKALAGRGVTALGVDLSPAAARLARRNGVAVLVRSIFGYVPGTGEWRTALLLDGNLGIGADPAFLLRRVAALLAPHGEALVELEPPGTDSRVERLQLELGEERSGWFRWALVGFESIDEPAHLAGFGVAERWRDGDRYFAQLKLP